VGFTFKLQKVLEVRKTAQDLAQKDFQEALYDQRLAEEELRRLENLCHEAVIKRGQVERSGGDKLGAQTQQIHEFLQGMLIKMARQKQKIIHLRTVSEEKRLVLKERSVELKAMEKLREKKKKTYLENLELARVKEADDLIIMRYGKEDT
jgi:flagellar export protein FliJ